MYRGIGAAATSISMHPSSSEVVAASGNSAEGSTHAVDLPGPRMVASTHAGTSTQELTGAGSVGSDAADQGQQKQAHAAARSMHDEAAHASAMQEQPAQAVQRQGGALGGPSASGQRSASASRWAAFHSCSGKVQGVGPGLQRASATQHGPPERADDAHSELEGLSMQRAGEVRAAPVTATRWDGVAHHAQARADVAFTTAVD